MMHELVIDNFAGGGGASTGLEWAFGRPVDIAINHDEAAIAVHAANHPSTKHYCQSIFSVDPMDATEGRPVALIWFSPDCKHHSKAKGGKPREKYIRDMAWVVPHWIERLKKATVGGAGAPRVIMLENVEEFRQWGPLDEFGKPIPERRGEEFDLWVRRIRKLGYAVEYRELRACDYGAPTSRKRLFLIARRDGQPIVWPKPTHRPAHINSDGVVTKWAKGHGLTLSDLQRMATYRTAAECIDWSIPCPSIFGRKQDLKPATCRRIAAGVMRYVVNAAKPFIVPVTHTSNGDVAHSIDEPTRTITTAKGGELAVVTPFFARTAHGEVDSNGKKRGRGSHGPEEPWPTVLAKGDSALIAPTLVGVGGRRSQSPPLPANGPHPTMTTKADSAIAAASLVVLRRNATAKSVEDPLGTATASGGHFGLTAATMVQMGYGEAPGQAPRALDLEKPIGTLVGTGKHGLVAAFMAQHNGGERNQNITGHAADEPISTISTRGTQQQAVQVTLIQEGDLAPDQMESAVKVAAFLIKYYGSEVGQHQPVDVPFDTITAKPRFAVITVTIDAQTYILVDIGMRMLTARELANATGFPADYILDPECWYLTESGRRKFGRLPKTHQIAKIGNAVCPIMSEVLASANLPELCGEERAVA